jgi:hypothetical protein
MRRIWPFLLCIAAYLLLSGFKIVGVLTRMECSNMLKLNLTDLSELFPGEDHYDSNAIIAVKGSNIFISEGIYYNDQKRFIRSFDNGQNWNMVHTPVIIDVFSVPRATGTAKGIDTYDGNVIYLQGDDSIPNNPFLWKSTDGGSNWSKTGYLDNYPYNTSGYYFFIKAFSNDKVYVVYSRNTDSSGNPQIRFSKTYDGGTTWSSSIVDSGEAVTAYFLDEYKIYLAKCVSSQMRVYVSIDGGSTWNYIDTSVPCYGPIYVKDPNTWYIVVGVSGDLRLYKTTDGGSSWTYSTIPINGTSAWYDIAFIARGSHFLVIYNDTSDYRVEFIESMDEGQGWIGPTAVTSNQGFRIHGAIREDDKVFGSFCMFVNWIENTFVFHPEVVCE